MTDACFTLLVGAGCDRLVGRLAKEHRGESAAAQIGFGVDGAQKEQARDPAVVLLRERANLSRSDDAHEPGLLEHLQVVPRRALRNRERGGELGGARGALVQQRDDPATRGVSERTKLLRLVDDEDVVELVVRRTVDDRETYDKSRPFAMPGEEVRAWYRPDLLYVATGRRCLRARRAKAA